MVVVVVVVVVSSKLFVSMLPLSMVSVSMLSVSLLTHLFRKYFCEVKVSERKYHCLQTTPALQDIGWFFNIDISVYIP